MGRIRTIKPQMFTDEDLGDCSTDARWLFAGLFTLADREGRLEDRPRKIKVEVMPYDKVNIENLLGELTEARFITRYQVNGKRYIHIRTFWKHQHFNIKEPPSQLPPPPGVTESTVPAPYGHRTGTVSAPVENAGKGREGKGKGKEGKEEDARAEVPADPPPPELFSQEFFDNLQDQKKFQRLDVRDVFQKWTNHCKATGKEPTPEYFLNWLNREEPRKGNGANGDDDDRGTSAQAARVAAMLERDN